MLTLGIDAGASATKWALLDSSGTFREGTSLPMDGHINNEGSKTRMLEVLNEIFTAAPAERISGIYAGITGIPETGVGTAEIEEIFTGVFGDVPMSLVSDIELGYRANFALGEGIFLYAGTGSIALHINQQGKISRAGGWGYLLGDEGAGYWIGREAIRRTLLTLESGSPIRTDSFEDQVLNFIHCRDWKEIKSFVYSRNRSKVAEIARLVLELAEKGDEFANQILQEGASALANLVWRLEATLGKGELPIVFAGGLSTEENLLSRELIRQLARPVRISHVRAANRAAELAREDPAC